MKLLFALALVVFAVSPAVRADLYTAQQKADSLSQFLRYSGYQLTPDQVVRIESVLDEAQSVLYPPISGNLCDVAGAGDYNGYRWNYRILLNGSVLDSANSLETFFSKLRTLRDNRVCEVALGSCSLSGAGDYNGYRWNYLLKRNGATLVATNSLETVGTTLRDLESNGVCSTRPTQSCQLSGAGDYNGYRWNYRITIGNETVSGTNSLDTATRTMDTLRSLRLCF